MEIRLATGQDVAEMMALEARHYFGNLDVSELAEGFVSILHPQERFDWAVDSEGLHVAIGDDGAVVGLMAVTDPPSRPGLGSSPISQPCWSWPRLSGCDRCCP